MRSSPLESLHVGSPAGALLSRPHKDDFKAVARALGCDEDKATFEAKLKKIAKAKPKPKS